MKIPVIKSNDKIQPQGPAYIIGRDGFYLRKSTRLYDCLAKIKCIPHYAEVKEHLLWQAPKIPYALIEQSLAFFRDVHEKYSAEAIALFAFDEDAGWELIIPEQDVSAVRLNYRMPLEKGKRVTPVGSIHSHCGMRAFFSETDNDDAADFDGIHIVIGKVDLYKPEIMAGVTVNGRTFEINTEEVIGCISIDGTTDNYPHEWLEKVFSPKDGRECFYDEWDGFGFNFKEEGYPLCAEIY